MAIQTQHIQPMPAPASWEVADAATPDGVTFVVLAFHSVNGTHVQFMDAASAKGLAAALEQRATQVGSGLILPPANPLLAP
jgi:hypothetical protein